MKKYLFAVLSSLLIFSACTNEENGVDELQDITTEEYVETSEDATISQNFIEEAADEADFQIEYRSGGNPPEDCPIVTNAEPWGTFPNTITIDYGEEGCEGPRGHILRGKLIVNISAPMNQDGATKVLTTENFFIDGAQVEGIRTKTNTGTDVLGNHSFSRTVNVDITYPNGDVAHWEAQQYLSQIEGGGTPTVFDNVFQITGSSSGINRRGNTFSAEITEPLIKRKDCGWVESGMRDVTRNERSISVDYGDGECNRLAEVTLPNGQVRTIILQRWW